MVNNALCNLIVNKICAVHRINVKPNETVCKVDRERCAIAIKSNGKTIYTSEGKKYISDSNHVVFLPRGITYKWVCVEPGECLMIEFETNTNYSSYRLESFKVKNQSTFINIFNRMELSWTFKKTAYTIKCMSDLYEILAKLIEFKSLNYELSTKYYIIEPSVKYLEEHYNDPEISNDMLAEISGVSTVYFRKIFTGIYKVSPMQYIQSIRIEKAKNMLIGDYYSVGDIASDVGFNNIYHFSKIFKKVTGYSPTEFSRL
jgi:AraC-like DNA-binding protein